MFTHRVWLSRPVSPFKDRGREDAAKSTLKARALHWECGDAGKVAASPGLEPGLDIHAPLQQVARGKCQLDTKKQDEICIVNGLRLHQRQSPAH
jgi:hypothetical protein